MLPICLDPQCTHWLMEFSYSKSFTKNAYRAEKCIGILLPIAATQMAWLFFAWWDSFFTGFYFHFPQKFCSKCALTPLGSLKTLNFSCSVANANNLSPPHTSDHLPLTLQVSACLSWRRAHPMWSWKVASHSDLQLLILSCVCSLSELPSLFSLHKTRWCQRICHFILESQIECLPSNKCSLISSLIQLTELMQKQFSMSPANFTII